ncbi:hypothetical protein GYMLUDRAFT_34421 [Collybiopsis luxurians FD-317 M1]|nr:hypothetical protein GYMLUDRAFT_34421 [Collybiopsis luxurians FD-317 M1]
MSKSQPEPSSSSPSSPTPSSPSSPALPPSPSRSPKTSASNSPAYVDLRHVTSSSALSPTPRSPPTSTSGTRSNRVSAHYPSMSSTSIPSSPTSVHSSSSAIFERDIEPLPTSPSNLLTSQLGHAQHPSSHLSPTLSQHAHFSPSHLSPTHLSSSHPPNPHHIPRGHTTESLEQNVPSVLDSAAEILSQMQFNSSAGGIVGDNLIVEAPAAPRSGKSDGYGSGSRDGRSSGWASPRSVGSFRSRSPSPFGQGQGHGQGSLLLSIPPNPNSIIAPVSAPSPQNVPASPPRPTISTSATVLNSPPKSPRELGKSPNTVPTTLETPVETPTSAYFSVKSDDEPNHVDVSEDGSLGDEEPRTTTRDKPPEYPWLSSTSSSPISPSFANVHPSQQPSSPMSPSSPSSAVMNASPSRATIGYSNPNATKRLSFLSYTDLLTSTPISTLPLSSFTTGAGAGMEPPHITGVGIVTAAMGEGPGTNTGVSGKQMSSSPRSSFIAITGARSHSPPSPSSSPHVQGFTGSPIKKSSMNAPMLAAGTEGSTSTVTAASGGSKRNSLTTNSAKGGNSNRGSIVFLDDLVGGEWEREGLGRGLDERLEGIMT